MQTSVRVFLLFGLIPAACTAPSSTASSPEVQVARPESSHGPRATPKAKLPALDRVIRDGAVGDVVIGQPIPPRHLGDDARYEARWVADAQPMEGFLIGEPPIWASIRGPLEGVDPGPLEELKPKLAPMALEAARRGTPVLSILIEHPGVATAEGIGVGSTYAELEAAYGTVSLLRDPEEFDNKITCKATVSVYQRVRFLLESCKAGTAYGPVKRIHLNP